MSSWLKGLNPEQCEAVCHTNGPLLILAGAGSGKTTVLVSRTGRLVDEESVDPSQICVLTFTNKAAREIKERLIGKIGEPAKKLWAGTFHSFGLQFLRKHHKLAELPQRFGVIDAGDAVALLKEMGQHVNVGGKKSFEWEKVLNLIGYWRASGQKRAAKEDEYEEVTEVLLPKYLDKLRYLGVVDFDSLLLKPIEIMEKNTIIRDEVRAHFRHLMVDEFQDTNELQMRLIRQMIGSEKNIVVVGDDDQSIYGWRGAQVENILGFPKMFENCQVVRLERNYRSTPEILKVANSIIENNSKRHDKVLKPSQESQGETPEIFVYENEEEECERTVWEIRQLVARNKWKYEDIAILYRSNGQSAFFEAELRNNQIPHKVTGGTAFFSRKESKDILAYLRCSLRPNEVALRRILNTPTRGIGAATIEKIEKYAEEQKISFFKSLCRWRHLEVTENTGRSIDEFLRFLKSLPDKIINPNNHYSAGQNLLLEMEACGYRNYIQQTSAKPEVFQKRWRFVEVFCGVLDRFVAKGGKTEKALRDFVDAMELRDSPMEEEEPGVQLMTFHASKGLEFPVVFLVGVEEDVIPHKTLGKDISEERRLFYVGVTRAKKTLILSRASTRKQYGKLKPSAPSRFLLEIPEDMVRTYERGIRPLDEGQRKTELSSLFADLDAIAASQKIR